jgi:hypothetical protein
MPAILLPVHDPAIIYVDVYICDQVNAMGGVAIHLRRNLRFQTF